MALDSRAKRGALLGLLPAPNGAIAIEDRFGFLGLVYYAPAPVPEFEPDRLAAPQIIGEFEIDGFQADGESITFSLVELTTRTEVKTPRAIVTREAYPDAPETSIGARLPLVYGRVQGVGCVCLDGTANTFAAAGHEITGLGTVRIDGVPAIATDVDLLAATFTLAGYTSGTVTADLLGKPHPTGPGFMVNAADVIEDLLTVEAGEAVSMLDADAFTAARDYWRLGVTDAGQEVTRANIALAVTDSTEVSKVIETVLVAAFGLLYVGHEGLYKLKAWRATHPEGILTLTDADVIELKPEASKADLATAIVASYRERPGAEGYTQVYVAEDEAARLALGLSAHKELEATLPFYLRRDVEGWTSRVLAMRRAARLLWSLKTHQAALLLEPGDCLGLSATCFDVYGNAATRVEGIFEVIQVEKDPTGGEVGLILSDVRGLGSYSAFLMAGDEVLPASLGGGAALPYNAAWTAAAKVLALRRGAYVCDEFGMIDAEDPETFHASTVS